MKRSVRADEIVVGDVVMLSTRDGDQIITVREVIPRTATIKFVGRTQAMVKRDAGTINWGWPPDALVTRVRRVRRVRRLRRVR